MRSLHQVVRLIDFSPSSHFFHANLTKLYKDFNSLGIAKIGTMGDKEIFLFMNYVNIFDLIVEFLPTSTCSTSLSLVVCTLSDSTSKRLLGILALIKVSCFVPQSQFNYSRVASSSSTKDLQIISGNIWHHTILPMFLAFVLYVPHTKIGTTFHSTIFHLLWQTTFNTFRF